MHYWEFFRRILVAGIILFKCSTLHAETAELSPQRFVEIASLTSMSEVEMAKIAMHQSDSQAVIDFAQSMVTESANHLISLRMFAKDNGLSILSGAELEAKAHKYIFARKGQSFNSAYVAMRVAERKKLVMLYRTAINSSNSEIKNFAEAHLPELMRDLYMAQQLSNSVNFSSTLVATNP